MIRKAVIYRGDTYLRAKDLGIDGNTNIEIQAVCHANQPRAAKGFGAVRPMRPLKMQT